MGNAEDGNQSFQQFVLNYSLTDFPMIGITGYFSKQVGEIMAFKAESIVMFNEL